MSLRTIGQRGDTIVEVLISVAVISLVLAAAYAITSRNTATTQDTQEHNQAQQIVQQQIERMRAMSASGTLATLDAMTGGCIIGSGSTLTANAGTDGSCDLRLDGATCAPGDSPCFHVAIKKDASTKIYHVAVSWDGLRGDTSSISMEYGI
jgi:prepilin-type N-terminal cleavage/methylation domain-containing protein